MPCVFPVLFLKGLALVNSGNEERHKLRAHGLVYAAGILVSFWALVAVLLGLRAAGAHAGLGIPVPVAGLSGADGRAALLPGAFARRAIRDRPHADQRGRVRWPQKQGYTGSFFTGVLAVVVATPCTAPFMGAAVGYALAQPAAVTFAVFTALALGLAAPYVALTLQPAWTRLLPKPGAWMEVLRQAVSVPIFATVIWLAWVLAQAYGAGLLAALLASFLLLAIAGWFLGRWPAKRWASAVAALDSAGRGCHQRVCAGKAGRRLGDSDCAGDERTLAAWSEDGGQPFACRGAAVFVDFTANWCLSCQVNERVALDQPEVEQAFQAQQRGPAEGRLDPPRRGHYAGLDRSGPQRRSGLCALYSGPERAADAAGGADAGHCDRCFEQAAEACNQVRK